MWTYDAQRRLSREDMGEVIKKEGLDWVEI